MAILISTAFVTATLLAGGVIQGTTHDMVAAEYARADVVVSMDDASERGGFVPAYGSVLTDTVNC